MSSSPGAGYKLRPNKAVDRELFLSLLTRLSAPLKIEQYQYIGLGGAFLEDFRLVHSRTGISKMTSIDSDEQTHLRQIFNRPVETVECIHSTLDEYLETTEFETPVVLWMDFTDPSELQSQIDLFATQVTELPEESMLRITLNANPSSLGNPGSDVIRDGVKEWRLERLKERLPEQCPAEITPEQLTQKEYGRTLLKILSLAADKALLLTPNLDIVWCLATQYSDGQFMVTATAIITEDKERVETLVNEWEYRSTPETPHILDMPALSTLERITLEAYEDPRETLNFELPKSSMKVDPIEMFKKYYRVFPHFTRVEI